MMDRSDKMDDSGFTFFTYLLQCPASPQERIREVFQKNFLRKEVSWEGTLSHQNDTSFYFHCFPKLPNEIPNVRLIVNDPQQHAFLSAQNPSDKYTFSGTITAFDPQLYQLTITSKPCHPTNISNSPSLLEIYEKCGPQFLTYSQILSEQFYSKFIFSIRAKVHPISEPDTFLVQNPQYTQSYMLTLQSSMPLVLREPCRIYIANDDAELSVRLSSDQFIPYYELQIQPLSRFMDIHRLRLRQILRVVVAPPTKSEPLLSQKPVKIDKPVNPKGKGKQTSITFPITQMTLQSITLPALSIQQSLVTKGLALIGRIEKKTHDMTYGIHTPQGPIRTINDVNGFNFAVMHQDLITFSIRESTKSNKPSAPQDPLFFTPNREVTRIQTYQRALLDQKHSLYVVGILDTSSRPRSAVYQMFKEDQNGQVIFKCIRNKYPDLTFSITILREKLIELLGSEGARPLKDLSPLFYLLADLTDATATVLAPMNVQQDQDHLISDSQQLQERCCAMAKPRATWTTPTFSLQRNEIDENHSFTLSPIPKSGPHPNSSVVFQSFGNYAPHYSKSVLKEKIDSGCVVKCSMVLPKPRVGKAPNQNHGKSPPIDTQEIYLKCDGFPVDISIFNKQDRNRSFTGQDVYVELYPRWMWKRVAITNHVKNQLKQNRSIHSEPCTKDPYSAQTVPFEGDPHLFIPPTKTKSPTPSKVTQPSLALPSQASVSPQPLPFIPPIVGTHSLSLPPPHPHSPPPLISPTQSPTHSPFPVQHSPGLITSELSSPSQLQTNSISQIPSSPASLSSHSSQRSASPPPHPPILPPFQSSPQSFPPAPPTLPPNPPSSPPAPPAFPPAPPPHPPAPPPHPPHSPLIHSQIGRSLSPTVPRSASPPPFSFHPITMNSIDFSTDILQFNPEKVNLSTPSPTLPSIASLPPRSLPFSHILQPTGFIVGVCDDHDDSDISSPAPSVLPDTSTQKYTPKIPFSGFVKAFANVPPNSSFPYVLVKPFTETDYFPDVCVHRSDIFTHILREYRALKIRSLSDTADTYTSNTSLHPLDKLRMDSLKKALTHRLYSGVPEEVELMDEIAFEELLNSIRENSLTTILPSPLFVSGLIVEWQSNSQLPIGQITSILGCDLSTSTTVQLFLARYGWDTAPFSQKVLAELPPPTFRPQRDSPEYQTRRSFHGHRVYTIDPEESKDLDDAISVGQLTDPIRLPEHLRDQLDTFHEIGVHIADVTHFLQANSPLDKLAQHRSTSHYLVGSVITMLPKLLSNSLCSLEPGVDRFSVSVTFVVDGEGEIVEGSSIWVGRSIINSCCRLSYEDVQAVLFKGQAGVLKELSDEEKLSYRHDSTQKRECHTIYPFYPQDLDHPEFLTSRIVKEDLGILWKHADCMRQKRQAVQPSQRPRTHLLFELSEDTKAAIKVNFSYSDNGDISEIDDLEESTTSLVSKDPLPGNGSGLESHQLIEELMLTANRLVCAFVYNVFPNHTVVRTQQHPHPALISQLTSINNQFGLGINFNHNPSSNEQFAQINNAFQEAAATLPVPIREGINCHLQSWMQSANYSPTASPSQAQYSQDDRWTETTFVPAKQISHYNLGFPLYTHFSSPIRRYPDEIMHRLVIAAIELRKSGVGQYTGTITTDQMIEQDCIHPAVSPTLLPLSYFSSISSFCTTNSEVMKRDNQMSYRLTDAFLGQYIHFACKNRALSCVGIVTNIEKGRMSINVPGLNIRSQLLYKDDLHINYGIPTDQSLPVILNHAIAKQLSPPMTPEMPYSMLRIRTQLAPEPEFPAPSPSFTDDPEMDCTMLLDALSFPFLSTSSNCVKRALPTSHTPLFGLKTNIRDIRLFERVKVLVRPVSIILDGENANPPGYSLTVVEFIEHRLESNVEIVPLTKQQLPGIPMKQRDQKPH